MRASSIEAHQEIKPKKQAHYELILKAMSKIGEPAICRSISYQCELSYHQIQRRISEMEKNKLVKVVGRDITIKNRPLLWDLV